MSFTDEAFVNDLFNSPTIDTKRISDKNGELLAYTAEYKGIKLNMHPKGYTVIKGSLHKFFNNGNHNSNDFSITNVEDTIQTLASKLNLTPERTVLSNLEFGVNIQTPFNPDLLIGKLIRYKDKPFNIMKVIGKGNGRECYYNQYGIKIYNKGLQFGKDKYILRIEKKIIVMCALKYGRIYLSDLTKKSLWKHCFAELLEVIRCLTIGEQIEKKLLNKKQIKVYNDLPNTLIWNSYSRNKKCRDKKVFDEIIESYGKEKYRSKLLDLVSAKCKQLAE